MERKFLVLIAAIFTTLSTSTNAEKIAITHRQQFPIDIIKMPTLLAESKAEVGNTLISAVASKNVPSKQLDEQIDFQVQLLFGSQRVIIQTTPLPYIGENPNGTLYGKGRAGIFIPKSEPTKPLGCYLPDLSIICDPLHQMGIYPKIKDIHITELPTLANRRELIYLGGNSKSISILYREYSGDYIKPAFSQEYKYDISEDNTIGFKEARIEIINSNNTEITYKVIKHLE